MRRRALAALREFGLVRADAEGLLQAEAVTDAHEFLRLLRRRVVLPPEEVGSNFQGAPDLRAALVWLMRQSPMVPLHYAVNVQTNMPAGLFTNDTRWNGFRWWSRALGFGQEALKALAVDADSKAKIIPDPTVAVIDVIRHPFGDALPRGQQIPIDKLLEFLTVRASDLARSPERHVSGVRGQRRPGHCRARLGLVFGRAAADPDYGLPVRSIGCTGPS